MALKPKPTPAPETQAAPAVLELAEAASALAPIIYFEEVPTFGHMSGIIRITLDALRIYPGSAPNTVKTDRVLVAHLRTNLLGARMLRDALDKALLMANPLENGSRN